MQVKSRMSPDQLGVLTVPHASGPATHLKPKQDRDRAQKAPYPCAKCKRSKPSAVAQHNKRSPVYMDCPNMQELGGLQLSNMPSCPTHMVAVD